MIIERPGKRRMRWVVEYRDSARVRRYKTCYSLDDAKRFQAEKVIEPGGNPHVRVVDVVRRWLEICEHKVRSSTLYQYKRIARLHILPGLGDRRVADVRPSDVELLLANKLKAGLGPKTVANIAVTLFGIFKRAERDGLIRGNPVTGIAAELGLSRMIQESQGEIKAMTSDELDRFLREAQSTASWYYPIFLTMARTGMRIGEARALQWEDIDFEARLIRVARSASRGNTVTKTKTGRVRRVDMSAQLVEVLGRHRKLILEEKLRRGWPVVPSWVFFSKSSGRPMDVDGIRKMMKLVLDRGGLPGHFTPHSLRHTFACAHLKNGSQVTYIQRQIGHASIAMTVDTYGKWLPLSDLAAADALDS